MNNLMVVLLSIIVIILCKDRMKEQDEEFKISMERFNAARNRYKSSKDIW